MKEFKCKDAGFACEWKTQGQTDQEVINNAREHGRSQHHLKDEDMRDEKLRPMVHDVR